MVEKPRGHIFVIHHGARIVSSVTGLISDHLREYRRLAEIGLVNITSILEKECKRLFCLGQSSAHQIVFECHAPTNEFRDRRKIIGYKGIPHHRGEFADIKYITTELSHQAWSKISTSPLRRIRTPTHREDGLESYSERGEWIDDEG